MTRQAIIVSVFVLFIIILGASCKNRTEQKKESEIKVPFNYEEKGIQAANSTKTQLGKNLLAAIQEYGTAGAVEFCNTRAMVLTDSMGKVLQVTVKRVSDQPRNINNTANADELAFIEELKSKLSKGEALHPRVFELNGKMVGYYPIQTNSMCLQCHGIPNKTIQAETLNKISKLYPLDKATGYGENDIRGLFVIEMEKEN
jgi:hypothetical protein